MAPLGLHAQPVQQIQRGPDNGTRTFVSGIEVLPQPALPFSGADKITWSRPIEGGGSITTYLEAKIYRDSQGRVYREAHHFNRADVDPQTTLYEFTIYDPGRPHQNRLRRPSHLCHVTLYRPVLRPPAAPPVGRARPGTTLPQP